VSYRASLEPTELTDLGADAGLLQSGFWGYYKQETGQRALPFRIDAESNGNTLPFLILERKLPGGFSLGYVPHGPQLAASKLENPAEFLYHLSDLLRPYLSKRCVFLRFDLPWRAEDFQGPESGESDVLIKAPVDIQPPSTVIIDLTRGEDAILSGMKSKTRYNIRLSEKRGVNIRFAGVEDLPAWYEMYRETAVRDKITIHSYDYYQKLFSCREAFDGMKPEVLLLLATVEGELVAGNIVIFSERQAVYLYGASSARKRNSMPTYALQWAAIQAGIEKGCSNYDLFGIPPSNAPEHPMHGLYRFKTGFGGEIVHRTGCWDFLLKPSRYRMLRLGEQARDYYFKKIRKR
jgi:lipid II:glycine glycyltransferase (peptidoglycan interpeptide bridge formation enzyme)